MTIGAPESDDDAPAAGVAGGLDVSRPHPARRYDYWLGGKDNFAADRQSGDAIEKVFPHIRTAARANRDFLHRTVRCLAAEAGIRQFLDIGTGLPTADNTHDIAQRVDPTCRIVYADNDPLVLAHARALLTSHPPGRTAYLHADLRRPDDLLRAVIADGTLDLTQPVAVMLVAVLHFIHDDAQASAAVDTLMRAMPTGSYLTLSHATADFLRPSTRAALSGGSVLGSSDFTSRTRTQVEQFFKLNGLTLIPPGVTVVSDWRPDPDTPTVPPEHVSVWGGIAAKNS